MNKVAYLIMGAAIHQNADPLYIAKTKDDAVNYLLSKGYKDDLRFNTRLNYFVKFVDEGESYYAKIVPLSLIRL